MKRRLHDIRGMSLAETMVALLITGIISMAMFKVYINQHQSWIVQNSVVEMQQNARASIDELGKQLRMTGYGIPNGLVPLITYDTNPDTVILNYNTEACTVPIVHSMPQPSAELRCDGYDVGCYHAGQKVYIYDPFVETGEFFQISNISVSSSNIQHNKWTLSRSYPAGSMILTIVQLKYYIDRSDTLAPKMMVQVNGDTPQIYADFITDLQFTYKMKDGSVVNQTSDAKNIRMISITVTSRSAMRDVAFKNIPYRFRVYSTNVLLRNSDA